MIVKIIDVETCGLPPDNAQIVEVATVDLEWHPVDDGTMITKRGKMWSSLVNPGRPIPPESSAVHHITDEMVKDAPRFSELPPFLTGADILAAHNAKFDRECLKLNGSLGIDDPQRWICSYKCGVLLFPDAPNHKNQTLRYFLGLKLADSSIALPHRAMGDAYCDGGARAELSACRHCRSDGGGIERSNPAPKIDLWRTRHEAGG